MPKKSNKLAELSNVFNDNNITAETIELNDDFILELKKRTACIKDYRNEAYTHHLLGDVVMITFFAVLANADEWSKIEVFAKEKEAWLRKYLELPYGIPTDDTIRLIISNIDSGQFYAIVVQLLIETINKMLSCANISAEDFDVDIIAIDGKESKGSKREETDRPGQRSLQTLNVYSNSYRMCLTQEFIAVKTNEIPAAQAVLKMMDLHGSIVTSDAMNCQKETVATIVKSKGDYVLAIKGNQKQFYQEVKEYFTSESMKEIKNTENGYYRTIEKEHGGTAVREYYITNDIKWFSERAKWNNLNIFGLSRRTLTQKNGEISVEDRYYIGSINAEAELFAKAVRGHWGIENNLHWMLDFVFKDDKNTSMAKTGAKNMQIMKKIALAVLGIVKPSYNMSMPKIRYKLSLSYETEMEKLLSLLSVDAIEKALGR